jgi:signal transduction histidine kinase
LINDILDLSAIEAGKQPLVREALMVGEVAADCTPVIAQAASEKNIELSIEVPDGLPPLFADKRAVKQILFNLLSNAVKYTPDYGKILFKATATNGIHTFAISDNGIGVAAEKLPGLTDPFVRSETNPHLTQEGSGLGLAIVKSLVGLHGGELDIKSEVGVGTTVKVMLPSAAAQSGCRP